MSVVPAFAQQPPPQAKPKPEEEKPKPEEEKPKPEPGEEEQPVDPLGPADKAKDGKLYDKEGREYRICPQCGYNQYKQGRMWICENCGYSYVE
jgi:hypothetical protein